MTLTVHGAEQIRRAVHFTDLIEPMRAAFRDYSAGRAQQTMSALWPTASQEDGDVLVKAGCIAGHDIFVVKVAPWFTSNELAGHAQGGLVAAFSSKDGHPLAAFADEPLPVRRADGGRRRYCGRHARRCRCSHSRRAGNRRAGILAGSRPRARAAHCAHTRLGPT